MPEIIIVNSKQPQKITTVYITPEKMLNQECLIGREERCCIVLQDSLVSRIHGKITFKNGNYYYTDLGSRNGSRLNNELTTVNQNYPLNPSDSLNLGSHLLWMKSVSEITTNPSPSPSIPKNYMPLATIEPTSINRWSKGELIVRCVQIISETDDVKTFRFVAEPPVLFTYQPGQFVTLKLEIDGQSLKSSYSISSSPSRPHTLDITVKRVPIFADQPTAPPDLVSNWLHDQLEIGSKIKIKGPMGKFSCFNNPAPKLLFISAGSGIIPLMSMARWLCDTVSEVDMIFCHSTATPQDLMFRSELELMATRYSNFKLAVTITRPETSKAWLGYTGRLNTSMLSMIAPDFEERNVYVCGSNSFLISVRSLLEQMDFPMENYYEESCDFEREQKSAHSVAQLPISGVSTALSATESFLTSKVQNSEGCSNELNRKKRLEASFKSQVPRHSSSSACQPHHLPSLSILPTSAKPATTEVIPFPSPINSVAATSSPIVWLAKSGQAISYDRFAPCQGGDRNSSILEAAQAQNISLPHGCGMGVCGHCKVKKLSGEVVYDEEVDCEAGYVLTCLAKPVGKVRLDV
ncbi:FHA domain containing protein [Stanieria cyanosphaera PCC 7437]|uniref:FHA domain containing protein n=1 Tax=Stanieria cyanosphaera (strain ATCC 29371 / PCC 7437) TaxID=111780 RepID=K9XYB4_STAC7|nr:FHA domain-containing protein [Stanieria cyanosphaera]AFZ36652.1 FHA domain containing protein [Stanieria cyanosphaera PCC 7437]